MEKKRKKTVQRWKTNIDEPVEQWYHKNLDIQNRTLYFGAWQPNEEVLESRAWMVDDLSTQNIIKGLYLLNSINNKPITVIWFSYGGDWNAGMAIYDFIKMIKSKVTIKAYGRIRSMGTMVLQACYKRLLSPNCEFLVHYGTVGVDEVHSKDFGRMAEEVKRCNIVMEDVYLGRIREKQFTFSRKAIQELLKYDKYLLPEEAINLGLADGVIK